MDPNLKKYFRTEVIDNKNMHFCKQCEFQTTIQKDMSFHIRKHMKKTFKFECEEFNCDQVFKTMAALQEHKANHLCGFGIPGMNDIGICGLNNLKQYYEMFVHNNSFKYKCLWPACGYVITRLDCIEKHVHRSHVCPYNENGSLKMPTSSSKVNKCFK